MASFSSVDSSNIRDMKRKPRGVVARSKRNGRAPSRPATPPTQGPSSVPGANFTFLKKAASAMKSLSQGDSAAVEAKPSKAKNRKASAKKGVQAPAPKKPVQKKKAATVRPRPQRRVVAKTFHSTAATQLAPAPVQASETVGVVMTALSLLVLLALLSFSPTDTSLNTSGHAIVSNWVGPAGAYIADLLLQGFGMIAYGLIISCLVLGIRSFFGAHLWLTRHQWSSFALLLVAIQVMAELGFAEQVQSYPAGGLLGRLIARFLVLQFSEIGAWLLSLTLGLAAFTFLAEGVLLFQLLRLGTWLYDWARHPAASQTGSSREKFANVDVANLMSEDHRGHVLSDEVYLLGDLDIDLDEELRPQAHSVRSQKPDAWGSLLWDSQGTSTRARQQDADVSDSDRVSGSCHRTLVQDPTLVLKDRVVESHRDTGTDQTHLPVVYAIDESLSDDDISIVEPSSDASQHPGLPDDVHEVTSKVTPEQNDVGMIPEAAPTTSNEARDTTKEYPKDRLQIKDVRPDVDLSALDENAAVTGDGDDVESAEYTLPPVHLLDYKYAARKPIDKARLTEKAQRLVQTLKHYGISGQVREIRSGPVITMYEFVPAPGTKLSKIAGLADDIAMSMEALRVRIVAPIPGKGAVGIEIPNDEVETVYLKEVLAHDAYRGNKGAVPMALGKDIEGRPYVADLAKMPHLLVAGATGAGKSVSINAMIMSILYRADPEDVKLLMVDPKMLELSVYEGIPHLLLPVVTDPKQAANALRWAVREMESRYKKLSALGVRNIGGFNAKVEAAKAKGKTLTATITDPGGKPCVVECERLPYIVIIVDELADLMMVASRDVEASIMRLAQMARAAGIHLILATQRPSVDVLTGVIKANFPTRIAFQVASKHDSRTILDAIGAEHLLGRGDMLFQAPGGQGVVRVHGSFVSDEEIERSVAFIKEQAPPQYDESILKATEASEDEAEDEEPKDELYEQALSLVTELQSCSTSMVQRKLRIGYNRAARLVEQLEADGVVGPADGAKPREVYLQPSH